MDAADVRLLYWPRQHCQSPAGGWCECERYHCQRTHPTDAGSKLRQWKHRLLSASGKKMCDTQKTRVSSFNSGFRLFTFNMDSRMLPYIKSWCQLAAPCCWLLIIMSVSSVLCFFCSQKQGAELELKDSRGWTALFHCTSTGHQQMVRFLLDNNADANVRWVLLHNYCCITKICFRVTLSFICREPGSGFTLLMEAAASGHEIIVQYLLDHVSRSPFKSTLAHGFKVLETCPFHAVYLGILRVVLFESLVEGYSRRPQRQRRDCPCSRNDVRLHQDRQPHWLPFSKDQIRYQFVKRLFQQ